MTTYNLTKHVIKDFEGIKAEIVYYQAVGVPSNILAISLPEARSMLSTRQGFVKSNLVLNNYVPEALWEYMHDETKDQYECYKDMLKDILNEYQANFDTIAFISTGVNMENLVWSEESYEELWVICFTTAGVKNNAIRIGKDKPSGIERNGKFVRFGTINNVVLTNVRLDQGALASTIITVTEAKNVALQELNIRSAHNKDQLATGTGTDQIVVVPGDGENCTYVQGHTKIGEMIAKTVIESTIEAINKNIENHNS